MTFYITDLMSLKDLNDRMKDGYVGVQSHPTLPLSIYNYTPKAMVDGLWDDVTEHCRGLIIENLTGKIVARGMSKFYNVGQKEAPVPQLHTDVKVTRKEDGSLGIVWEYGGEYGVATRGSFQSPQAIHATELLNRDEYWWLRRATDDISTPLVEIVYPEGRIVLDYGDRDELIPLGEVGPEGVFWFRDIVGDPVRDRGVRYMTYGEALALPIPDDEEGYVLDIIGMEGTISGHLKLKGDRYKYLHYIMTNLNAKNIWDEYVARTLTQNGIPIVKGVESKLGRDYRVLANIDVTAPFWETFKEVPDEFIDWVKGVWNDIENNHIKLVGEAVKILGEMRKITDGRERYETFKDYPFYKDLNRFMSSGDDSDMTMRILGSIMPSGAESPFKSKVDG